LAATGSCLADLESCGVDLESCLVVPGSCRQGTVAGPQLGDSPCSLPGGPADPAWGTGGRNCLLVGGPWLFTGFV